MDAYCRANITHNDLIVIKNSNNDENTDSEVIVDEEVDDNDEKENLRTSRFILIKV